MSNCFVWIWRALLGTSAKQKFYIGTAVFMFAVALTGLIEMIQKLFGEQSEVWSVFQSYSPYTWIPPDSDEDSILNLLMMDFCLTYVASCVIMVYAGLSNQLGYTVSWRYCEGARHTYIVSTTAYAYRYEGKRKIFIPAASIYGVTIFIITIYLEGCFGLSKHCFGVIEPDDIEDDLDSDIMVELLRPESQELIPIPAAPGEGVDTESNSTQIEAVGDLTGYLESLDLPFIDEDPGIDSEIATASTSLRQLRSPASGFDTTLGSIQAESQSKESEGGIELQDISTGVAIKKYNIEMTTSFLEEAKEVTKKAGKSFSGPGSPTYSTTVVDVHAMPSDSDEETPLTATGSGSQDTSEDVNDEAPTGLCEKLI